MGTHTLCQFFERDIVKPVHLLHDQLLLVDLDDERSVAFVSREPELANRVLQLLRDIYGVRLVSRKYVVSMRKEGHAEGRTNHGR